MDLRIKKLDNLWKNTNDSGTEKSLHKTTESEHGVHLNIDPKLNRKRYLP